MVKLLSAHLANLQLSSYITRLLLVLLTMMNVTVVVAKQATENAPAFANDLNHNASTAPIQQQNTLCMAQFAQAQPPVLFKPLASSKRYALCYEQFALDYSGQSKTPLWVAEFLTPKRLAGKVKREDVFHEEPRVRTQHQAWLSDYRDSGFDRGHMAPSGDMGNRNAQAQSFSLANIVPQNREHNQNVWRELEEATRALVSKQGLDIYVLTGPLYDSKPILQIGRGIWVPSAIYKVLYIPELKLATAYVSPNDATQQVSLYSVCALEQRAGINLLPQLNNALKRNVYQLPLSAKQVKKKQAIPLIEYDTSSVCPNANPSQQREAKDRFATAPMPALSQDVLPTARSGNQEASSPQTQQSDAASDTASDAASQATALQQAILKRLMNWLWESLVGLLKSL